MKKVQETSNEVGNKLYAETIKEIMKNCTSREQKILAEYLIERAPATQIFNISDVLLSIVDKDGGPKADEDVCAWVEEALNIEVLRVGSEGSVLFRNKWTPYVDDLFVYSNTLGENKYYVTLIHRLDESRVVMFFGVYHETSFGIFESITCEIDNLKGITTDYSHMYESVEKYIERNNILDYKRINFLLQAAEICFISFFATILHIFKSLTDRAENHLACYIDESADARAAYFRAPSKKVTKVTDKPIVLILNKDKDMEKKVVKYRRTKGNIHYAFSWVVRGHYRKLHNPKSLGMDRNGKRCVQGMTWIETYMKGDENLPLLKRERVVKP